MSDLVSLLLAAIEETEGIARKATGRGLSPWVADGNKVFLQSRTSGIAVVLRSWPNEVTHIARNDPAAVLRRCAADKAILKEHAGTNVASLDHGTWGQEYVACRTCAMGPRMVVYPCPTVKHLAAGYGISVEEETTGV